MDLPDHPSPPLSLETFLAEAGQFRLGRLPTEQPHPKTARLAEWSRDDVPRGLEVLREVDLDALGVLRRLSARIEALRDAVQLALSEGRRVFLCGCGATGRLAISLETFWRRQHAGRAASEQVVALMAGGDTALVSSIEGFEDHADYGARHLVDLGFGPEDLLVSCTEGGETAYVIGATAHAAAASHRRPWFLYCNPDEALGAIERSRWVLDDPRIDCFSIPTGPMALSGSTRMQASTVLMLAVGQALLQPAGDPRASVDRLARALAGCDVVGLARLVEAESAIYQAGEYVLYEAERHAITVLTDTTERAPTFNLASFENRADASPEPSLCYLKIGSAPDATAAWLSMLWRRPRPLSWPGFEEVAGAERLYGFDFSGALEGHRRRLLGSAPHHTFSVAREGDRVKLALGDNSVGLEVGGLSLLEEHLLLKLVLNAHSTLVMGRLGRYESNVMTWVRPSNRKLIDRAIRYVDQLWRLREGGESLPYERLAAALFAAMAELDSSASIVLETVRRLRPG